MKFKVQADVTSFLRSRSFGPRHRRSGRNFPTQQRRHPGKVFEETAETRAEGQRKCGSKSWCYRESIISFYLVVNCCPGALKLLIRQDKKKNPRNDDNRSSAEEGLVPVGYGEFTAKRRMRAEGRGGGGVQLWTFSALTPDDERTIS